MGGTMVENTFPACARDDCFGCQYGHCIVLVRNSFNKECPFFKTREQVAAEQEYCRKRLNVKYMEE